MRLVGISLCVALLALTGCQPSPIVVASETYNYNGQLLKSDGTPAANAAVTFSMDDGGSTPTTKTVTTDATGHFSYPMPGSEIMAGREIDLSATQDDGSQLTRTLVRGSGATFFDTGFQNLGTLQFWNGGTTADSVTALSGNSTLKWDPPPQIHGGSASYSIEIKLGDKVMWSQQANEPTLSLPNYLFASSATLTWSMTSSDGEDTLRSKPRTLTTDSHASDHVLSITSIKDLEGIDYPALHDGDPTTSAYIEPVFNTPAKDALLIDLGSKQTVSRLVGYNTKLYGDEVIPIDSPQLPTNEGTVLQLGGYFDLDLGNIQTRYLAVRASLKRSPSVYFHDLEPSASASSGPDILIGDLRVIGP